MFQETCLKKTPIKSYTFDEINNDFSVIYNLQNINPFESSGLIQDTRYALPEEFSSILLKPRQAKAIKKFPSKYVVMGSYEDETESVNYEFNNDFICSFPTNLSYLVDSIKKSEYIIELKEDWDDNNSIGYKYETWKSSIKFLMGFAVAIYERVNIQIDIPKIYHGPNGSIDILWEYPKYTLLINIAPLGTKGEFYCDNSNGTQTIKGEFPVVSFDSNLLPIPTSVF